MTNIELFTTKSSFWITIGVVVSIFLLRIGFSYLEYQEFVKKPFYFTNAVVLTQTKKFKNETHYVVLKLKSQEGYSFYTTSLDTNILPDTTLRVKLLIDDTISFWGYLGTFFVKTRLRVIQSPSENGLYNKVASLIKAQHPNKSIGNFYEAIFLAVPLEREVREQVARLGISHLVALSGFHLGILWGVVYTLGLLLYRPLQAHFFPYRHALFDVGLVAIIVLGWYVWFVGFPPSLVRAFAMVLAGWIVLLAGMRFVSFSFLGLVVALLLALLPSLVVSLAFWFSVAGVFYIFLLLLWFNATKPILMTLLVVPLGIFVLMQPIVHLFFGVTSYYQLLSPLLSLLFIPFYPLAIALHLFGFGNLLDKPLEFVIYLASYESQSLLPMWVGGVYIALSLLAIKFKLAWYGCVAFALIYSIYLFVFV